ncbi:MAG: hypothetical protein ABGX83_05465 [Nitrospira sp.]
MILLCIPEKDIEKGLEPLHLVVNIMKSSIIVNIETKILLRRRDARQVGPFITWKLQQAGIPLVDWKPGERHRIKDLALTGQVMQVVSMGNQPRRNGGRETTGLLRYFWMEGNASNKEIFAELRRILAEKDGRTTPPTQSPQKGER